MINRSALGSQIEVKRAERSRNVADKPKSAGNQSDFSSRSKRESRKIFRGGFGGHQDFLIGEARRGRLVCNKGQLQVVDDAVHHREVGEERDDLHAAAAPRADHGINFIDFPDHLSPALRGDGPQLFLHDPEGHRHQARLLDLSPMGVGVEAIISDRDLPLIRDMGDDPGDELQVVHPLYLSSVFPRPAVDPAFPFIQGKPL